MAAKTYPVSASGGYTNPAALDAEIVPPTVNTSKLSGIADSILASSDGLLCLVVDLANRKVRGKAAVAATATAIVATIAGYAGHGHVTVFNKVDQTKRSSIWTATGEIDYAISAGPETNGLARVALAPELPVLSTFQLIDRIEEATMEEGNVMEGAFIVVTVDQGTGLVKAIEFDDAATCAEAYATMAATIAYEQTVTAPGGATRQPLE